NRPLRPTGLERGQLEEEIYRRESRLSRQSHQAASTSHCRVRSRTLRSCGLTPARGGQALHLSRGKGRGPMQFTVTQLAELVQGRVHGDERTIRAARPMNEAGPDDITFIESDRHLRHLKTCRALTAVVPATLAARRDELVNSSGTPLTLLEVSDPLTAFVAI